MLVKSIVKSKTFRNKYLKAMKAIEKEESNYQCIKFIIN